MAINEHEILVKTSKLFGVCSLKTWLRFYHIDYFVDSFLWHVHLDFNLLTISAYFGFASFLFLLATTWSSSCCRSSWHDILFDTKFMKWSNLNWHILWFCKKKKLPSKMNAYHSYLSKCKNNNNCIICLGMLLMLHINCM